MNIIFQKMPKGSKKKNSLCEQHDFSLKPRSQFTLHPQYLQVSFCAKHQDKSTQPPSPDTKDCLDCPIFNRDANFATPTFILGSEQGIDEQQGKRMRLQHQLKMINYTDQKSELNVPKPRSKNNYCSVCRHNYTDYLQHIESGPHKKKIRTSTANEHILELARKFRHEIKIQRVKKEHNSQDLDPSVEIISSPIKKVKLNEEIIKNQGLTLKNTLSNNGTLASTLRESPLMNDPQRPIPLFQNSLNYHNYPFINSPYMPTCPYYNNISSCNLNINMNLYLNHIPSAGFNSIYNPYLDYQCQANLFSQLNQLSKFKPCDMRVPAFKSQFCPNKPQGEGPIEYIVIESDAE